MSRRLHAAAAARSMRIALAVAALLVVAGCGADPVVVYRDSAVSALEATLSEARTAELAARLWVAGRSTHQLAVVVVRDSDTGVGSEVSWFEQQQPPGRAGDLTRERTVSVLDATASAVQSVRIELDRSDRQATRAALDDLRSSCSALEFLAEELG